MRNGQISRASPLLEADYLPVHPQDKMGNGKTWQNSPIKRTHRLLLYLSKGTFGLPRWLSGKEPAWQYRNCSRRGFNTWVKKMPWRRKDYPHPCLENLMDRGAWQATVHGVAKSQTWLRTQENISLLFYLPSVQLPSLSPSTSEYIFCIDIFWINLVKKKALYTNYVLTMEFPHTFICFSV